LPPSSELEQHTGIRVDSARLEPGDHLLRWGDAGKLRYCHFVDEAELRRLVEGLEAKVIDTYEADGREERLNRYAVLRR